MKLCMICETPFQLLNCINYVYHQSEFENPQINLMVRNDINITEDMINALKDTGLFEGVYTYHYENSDYCDATSLGVMMYKARRLIFPKKYITAISTEDFDIEAIRSDYLYCTFPTFIAVAYAMAFPDIRIRYIDDGLGTYMGTIASPDTIKRRLIFFLKGHKSPWRSIDKIFVNNKKYYTGALSDIVYSLDNLGGEDYDRIINQVFSYTRCELYDNKKAVFFTQPLSTKLDDYIETDKKIIHTIEELPFRCALRLHPRQREYFDSSLTTDKDINMWELICRKQVKDSHILIGCFSTAQFSPKIIYDKEPWLVFTFELYGNLFSDKQINKMREMVKRLKEGYHDCDKVVIVSDIDDFKHELTRIIDKLISGNGQQ